jgi:hypothetical protein
MLKTTRPQRLALARILERKFERAPSPPTIADYRAMRRSEVFPGPGCIMVPFAGMWLGIEPDGYTHS